MCLMCCRSMDAHSTQYILDEFGYEDDVRLSNIKLLIGFGAVLVAAMAQFWPQPFPASKTVLIGLVGCYWILHGTLQAVHWFVDADCILITKPKDIPATPNKRAYLSPALSLKSDLKRFVHSFDRFTHCRRVIRCDVRCPQIRYDIQINALVSHG